MFPPDLFNKKKSPASGAQGVIHVIEGTLSFSASLFQSRREALQVIYMLCR
jgi:hypothetical protein